MSSTETEPKAFAALSAREHADLANVHAARAAVAADGGDRERALVAAHVAAAVAAMAEQEGDDPGCRAAVHNAMALLYRGLEEGDASENAELALSNIQSAVALFERAGDAPRAAAARANLGSAYLERRAGTDEANVAQGIHHLEKALKGLPEGSPEWLDVQGNLASAYQRRTIGTRADNVARAVRCIRDALAHVKPVADSERWTDLQNNLGNALARFPRDAGDLHEAITHYQAALDATERDRLPRQWADLHSNMSRALAELPDGDRAASIEHLRCALEVYTPHAFPRSHLETQRALGHKLLKSERFAEAHEAFTGAVDAERILFADAFTWDGRQVELASSAPLYFRDAYCLVRLGRLDESLARLEEGRARVLNETLSTLDPGPDTARIDKERERVRRLEAEHRVLTSRAPSAGRLELDGKLQEARKALVEAVEAVRPEGFIPRPGRALLEMIPPAAVLVAPIVSEVGTAVLIVPGGTDTLREVHVLRLGELTLRDVHGLLVGDHGWLPAYGEREDDPERWRATIASACGRLWDDLLGPVEAHARSLGLARGGEIVLLAPGLMGVLPLHAAMRTVNGTTRSLADDYVVSYAPSIAALGSSVRRAQTGHESPPSALVAAVPTKVLPFAALEAEAVLSWFGRESRLPLEGPRVTTKRIVDAAPKYRYLHFSCHGRHEPARPLRSSLRFARGALTLADILARLELPQTRLAVLSACETGLFDIAGAADEQLGLTAGFLQAGCACVVSSLWPVDDIATMLLMQRLYGLHLGKEARSPADALHLAQLWLKTATNEELAAMLHALRRTASADQQAEIGEQLGRFALARDPFETPFDHPCYWAAFVVHGV